MDAAQSELIEIKQTYIAAVDAWVAAIRKEEGLAATTNSASQVDRWEQAHFDEEKERQTAKAAKRRYEDALRQRLFGY